MNIIYYPDENSVSAAMKQDEPLLVLVSFDGGQVIVSQIDDAVEHHILLRKAGFSDTDIDKYFRLVVDHEGADWTFVCPSTYNSVTRKEKQIESFFKDGMSIIPKALQQLGYAKRYRRHFDMMG